MLQMLETQLKMNRNGNFFFLASLTSLLYNITMWTFQTIANGHLLDL